MAARDAKNQRRTRRKTRQKKETSKKLLDWIFYITIIFFVFCMYAMIKTNDLSGIDALAAIIQDALKYGIPAYMIRAYLKDKIDMEIMRLEELNELRQKYGEEFVYEEFDSGFIN